MKLHQYNRFRALASLLLGLPLLISCAVSKAPDPTREQATVDYELLLNLPETPISYETQVRPILEQRCVVCHGSAN